MQLTRSLGLDPGTIDVRERLRRYGPDARRAAGLIAGLSATLGRPLPATLVWDRGSAVNNDGFSNGLTASNPPIAFEALRLRVQAGLEAWKSDDGRPAYREAFDRCVALFNNELDRPLREGASREQV